LEWLTTLTPNPQAGADAYYDNQKWLPSTGSCLRSGYYLADIYINGTLAGSHETNNVRQLDQFDGRRFLDLGVATCRPSIGKRLQIRNRVIATAFRAPISREELSLYGCKIRAALMARTRLR